MTAEERALVVEARRRRAAGWPCTTDEVDALIAALDEAQGRFIEDPFAGLPTFKVGQY